MNVKLIRAGDAKRGTRLLWPAYGSFEQREVHTARRRGENMVLAFVGRSPYEEWVSAANFLLQIDEEG